MRTEVFAFLDGDGARLAGRLELPSHKPRGYALFAHCFTCGKDSLAAVRVSRSLAKAGIGVLRFDFAGVGDSEGAFGSSTLGGRRCGVIAAAKAMASGGRQPKLLIGHSLGGAAVLLAAGSLPQIKAVCTIGAPFDPAHLSRTIGGVASEAEASGAAYLTLGGRRFEVRRTFLEELRSHQPGAYIAALRRPLLVIHAATDDVVDIAQARLILSAAREPKRLVTLRGANHMLSRAADAQRVGGIISRWAAECLGL